MSISARAEPAVIPPPFPPSKKKPKKSTRIQDFPNIALSAHDIARLEQALRIEESRRSIEFHCKTYFPQHFYAEFGEHHRDIFATFEDVAASKRAVWAMPRDHGKSSAVIIGCVSWLLAHKLKNFILLFGQTGGEIERHIQALQEELDGSTGNYLLLNDFPHLRPAMDFKSQFVKWTDKKMRFASGATLEAKSLTSRFRGVKERQHRPDCIIVDDPQDEEQVATYGRRRRILQRFRKTIMNLGGDGCDIFVEGNLMHPESLIAELLLDPSWRRKLYMAENLPPTRKDIYPIGNTKQDGEPLWPSRWSMAALRKKLLEIKPIAYALEFLNRIRSEDDVVYDISKFRYFKRADLPLVGMQLILYWDPADPKRREAKTDFVAMTVLATKQVKVREGKVVRYYWILDVFLDRADPVGQVKAFITFLRKYPISKTVYEDNGGFGTMLPYIREQVQKAGMQAVIKRRSQHKNKVQRIMNALPWITRRTAFAEELPKHYMAQWDEFPSTTSKDDGPDSTVGALETFESKKMTVWAG